MVEYTLADKGEIAGACTTLIKKCAESGSNNMELDIQYGELMLHVFFAFGQTNGAVQQAEEE